MLKPKFINVDLTKKITRLQKDGYCNDYVLSKNDCVICLQDNKVFNYKQLSIRLVDHVKDHLMGRFHYLHAVETECGGKGILLLSNIIDKRSVKRSDTNWVEAFWLAF